jgi:hypothetical protein
MTDDDSWTALRELAREVHWTWAGERFVTREELHRALAQLQEEIMSTQADADALTAQLQQDEVNIAQVATDAAAASAKLQAELSAVASANPSVDLSAALQAASDVTAAIAPLDSAVQALGNQTPDAPATPAPVDPTQTPDPVPADPAPADPAPVDPAPVDPNAPTA